MILIPYFLKKDTNWTTFGLFLREGGTTFWAVEDKTTIAAAKKMLKDNGFPVISLVKTDGVLYANISPDINLSEYYLWHEMPLGSDEDLWRTFKIPVALWSCQVFKENFYRETNLPNYALKPLHSLTL
jgi:hypothetical protein